MLGGRATGSDEEWIAAQYIRKQLLEMDVQPFGDEKGYIQVFEFQFGKRQGASDFMYLEGDKLETKKDYYPIFSSGPGWAKGTVLDMGYGIQAPDHKHDDYEGKKTEGKILLIRLSAPEGDNPHSDLYPFADMNTKLEKAQQNKATAVIFVDPEDKTSDPAMELDVSGREFNFPVVFLTNRGWQKISGKKSFNAEIKTEFFKMKRKGHNVVGYIDNGAATTVVLGAHYDHLGHGENGGSFYAGADKQIHNGADDNASGVAMVLELMRELRKSGPQNHNYLAVLFSGEELGLYGSNFFTKNLKIAEDKLAYMLNFDMVGRLREPEKTLVVNGIGTSPGWAVLDKIPPHGLNFSKGESGLGPSDHSSFYNIGIPALHLFTGQHEDYHKPSDDEPLINYDGMESVHALVLDLIQGLDSEAKLSFTKTKEDENKKVADFKVTLGVMPDYMYQGEGLKIDGVKENKPAALAGLQRGDIIIKMGDMTIKDIYEYMEALAKYQKGQSTTVSYKRGEETRSAEIRFL